MASRALLIGLLSAIRKYAHRIRIMIIRRRAGTHGDKISDFHQKIYDKVREEVDFYEIDREIWPDIRAMEKFIRRKDLLDLIDEYKPELLENNAWGRFREDMRYTPHVK